MDQPTGSKGRKNRRRKDRALVPAVPIVPIPDNFPPLSVLSSESTENVKWVKNLGMQLLSRVSFQIGGQDQVVYYTPGSFNPKSPMCQKDIEQCGDEVYVFDKEGHIDYEKSANERQKAIIEMGPDAYTLGSPFQIAFDSGKNGKNEK